MTEVQRIQGRIATVEAEKRQVELNWQRCDGALTVLRGMLGEAMRAESDDVTGLAELVQQRMNEELPVHDNPAGEKTDAG